MELLVPIIRDACATAGESIRVCSVFTDWSRQLGNQIRVGGLTGTQLLQAIDELKKEFSQNHMDDHWLLPSISPLLALTAQELEKSQGGSSLGDTQTATVDGSFSKALLQQQTAKNGDGKSEENSDTSDGVAAASLDRILVDVEEKSVQLEDQLSALERKISETKDINASTRERINQLLLRLNTSSCLIQRTCTGESDDDMKRKQSSASVLSLEVTENDINQARQTTSDKSAMEPIDMSENSDLEKSVKGAALAPPTQFLQSTETEEAAETDKSMVNLHTSTENTEVEDVHEGQVEEKFKKVATEVLEKEPEMREEAHEEVENQPQDGESEKVAEGEAGYEVREETPHPQDGHNDEEEAQLKQINEETAEIRSRRSTNSELTPQEIEDQNREVDRTHSEEEHDNSSQKSLDAHPESENGNNDEEGERFGDDGSELGKASPDKLSVVPEMLEDTEEDKNDEDEYNSSRTNQRTRKNSNNSPTNSEEPEESDEMKARSEKAQENGGVNEPNYISDQHENGEKGELEDSLKENTQEKAYDDGVSELLENNKQEEDSLDDNLEQNEKQQNQTDLNESNEQQADEDVSSERKLSQDSLEQMVGQSTENAQEKDQEQSVDADGGHSARSQDEVEQKVGGTFLEHANDPVHSALNETNGPREEDLDKNERTDLRGSMYNDNVAEEIKNDEDTNAISNGDPKENQENNLALDLRAVDPSVDDDYSSTRSQSTYATISKGDEGHLTHIYDHDLNPGNVPELKQGITHQSTLRDATLSTKHSETLSSLGIIGALPEFEMTHKYHIQSHINTATRIPVISQPVNDGLIAHHANLFTENACTDRVILYG
ncbi:hypothetical protein RB195_020755 [Necator americanus]|uniref:Uncharacterized protein n=1 Tax=Necator americanus TaxID=51031 RepID=A0ABR1CKE5_NECAM